MQKQILKQIGLYATVLILLLMAPGAAQAQSSRLYLASYMGLNSYTSKEFSHPTSNGSIDLKNGTSFAGALGLRLTPNVRFEGEVSYSRSDLTSMLVNNTNTSGSIGKNLKTWLYMAHAYYDFDISWRNLTPFVSAGLGLAMHDGAIAGAPGGLNDASDTSYELAYSVGTGLKYQMKPGLALTGGYRYVGTTSVGLGNYDIDYSAHEIRAGLQYDLPVDMFK